MNPFKKIDENTYQDEEGILYKPIPNYEDYYVSNLGDIHSTKWGKWKKSATRWEPSAQVKACIHTHTHTHAYRHARTHAYIHTHTRARIHTHAQIASCNEVARQ